MNTLSIGAVAVCAVSLAACANKVEECNRLVVIVNANHSGEVRGNPGDHLTKVRANSEEDSTSVAALAILSPKLAEVRKLRDELQAGFKTRLDGEEALLAAAEEDPPNEEKAKAALGKMSASASMLKAAEEHVGAFCKAN